jgi:hypothetical protein
MGDDALAIADRLAIVDDIRKLAARCRGRIKYVFMQERQVHHPQESKDLQAIPVVVGHAEEGWIRVKSDHARPVVAPFIVRERKRDVRLDTKDLGLRP